MQLPDAAFVVDQVLLGYFVFAGHEGVVLMKGLIVCLELGLLGPLVGFILLG